MRGDGLLRDVLEGRMLGSRPQGRPRMGMVDELREVEMKAGKKKKESFGSMKRRAEDRQVESLCRGPAGRQKTNDDEDDA